MALAASAIAVPGGLALVAHAEGEAIEPDASWITVRTGQRTTLLQTPQTVADAPEPQQLPGPRWVIGEPDSLSDQWLALLDSPEVSTIPYADLADDRIGALADWPAATDLQAIDIFCGSDPNDPTGEKLVSTPSHLRQGADTLPGGAGALPLPLDRGDAPRRVRSRRTRARVPRGERSAA